MAGEGWIDVQVSGLKELEQNLKRLPDEIALKVLASAVFAGAAVVRDEAKRLCPVETGNLRNSIRIKRKKRATRNATVVYQVGPGRSKKQNGKYSVNGYYGHLVEFGTAPHIIKATKGKKLEMRPNVRASKGAAKRWVNTYADVVKHPGAPAKPFLRPAFDASTNRVIEAMRKRLAMGIERGEIKFWKRHIASRG
jgi:HK97 gp10 family phage protein